MARQWILALLQVLGVRAWSNCSDFGLPPYYYSCASEGAPLRCCDGRYQASFHSMCTLPALFRAPICEEVGPTAAPEASELGAVPLTRWPMLMAHDAATGYLDSPLSPVVPWARTQPKDPSAAFTTQLNCGARALDFRGHVSASGHLMFHHGDVEVTRDAAAAVGEIVHWAAQHPAVEDLVLLYSWDCTGDGCDQKMAEVFAKENITVISDCQQLGRLSLEEAARLARLPGGGQVLVITDCVQSDYDEALACSGFDGPSAEAALAALPGCGDLGGFEAQRRCGEALRGRLGQGRRLRSQVLGYYQCWQGATNADFAVKRLMDYLVNVSSTDPKDSFVELQALWQETPKSVAIGVAHFSSLIKDEEKSGLNAMMVEKIKEGVFKHINFFAPWSRKQKTSGGEQRLRPWLGAAGCPAAACAEAAAADHLSAPSLSS
ncbi:unnamed protein product [Effrenium voratum]|nr:unnamed protein product [Effrenium voratum]